MSVPITEQEYLNTQQDLSTLSNAINVDSLVTHRIGDEYKSIPMVIREFEEEKQARLQELDSQTGAKMLAIDDAKSQAEQFALEAKNASESSGLTTPKPISSENEAILTGHYFLNTLGGPQSEIIVTRTDSTIFQTKTTASGEILTRSFDVGATSFPSFVGQSVASIEALPTNAYTGMSMAVSDPARGGNFVFDAAKVGLNDGGYIINGWVRQTDHLEFRYWGVITVAAVLNKVFQTAINYNLPIRDYSETEITIPNANPDMAVASDFVAVRVLPGKTLTIETNCTINAMSVSFYGDQTKGKNLTAAAAVGQYTVTISDVTGIVPGSIITIRNNVDFSFADFSASNITEPNYRSFYKDGEMAQVLSVSGNTVTLTQPLISSYAAGVESEVTVFNSGKVSIKGLSVKNEIAPTLINLKLQHLLFPKLESVTATAHHVSSPSALEFKQCYGVENINPMAKSFASVVTGGNYGILINNSTNVTTIGGMAHGLTPGFATGGSDDAGAVPSRNIVTRGVKISNTNLTRHAADFHGNVRDSVYIDCEILGTVTVGGLNNGYLNCKIKSAAALVPIDLGELVGGTVDLTGTTVEVLSTGGVNRFIAYSSGTMAKGLKYDALLKVHNCTFIWGRGNTQLYSLILPTCSNAGATINLELVSPKLVGFESMTVERFVMYNISSGAKRASRFIMRGAINVKYNTLVYDALGAGAVVEYPESWGNDAAKGRWIKRKDGSAEVYLTLTVSAAIDLANSIQGFLSTAQIWNFPFSFIAPPTIEVTTGVTAAGAVTGTVTNALANYQLRSGATQTAASHVVHLVARGQWAVTP